ncbi:MAG: succinate dehydrogenase [Pyrinomonadaceae bacterium]|nr:succinate dehydrogenase [Pyrinomonadaceae bacterium]
MAVRLNRSFVLRKLFQLSGILPLGAFLIEHLYTNSKAVVGAQAYNDAVRDLQAIPYVLLLEIFGILLPLTFHAVYGLFITWEARPNNLAYKYARNWFYIVQRATGAFLFLFIFFHLLNFRFGLIPGLNEKAVAHHPDEAYQIVANEMKNPFIFILYIVGVFSTIWHLANGLWLFLVDWGVVIGARAQRITGYACIVVGVALFAAWLNSLVAFVRPGGLLGGILY